MKKRGISGALIGTILGVIFLLILVGITIKLLPSSKGNECTNNIYWDSFKEKLKDVEDGRQSTTFFKNGNCYLVSFSLGDIAGSPSADKINPPQQIKSKQKPAICLCKIDGNDCIINNYIKDCYLFEKTAISDTQYNTGDNIREDKNYIFITIKNQNSNLIIKDDVKKEINHECEKCGTGILNVCDKAECQNLATNSNAPCYYLDNLGYASPGGTCHGDSTKFYEWKLEP